jgi:hypothetical protein
MSANCRFGCSGTVGRFTAVDSLDLFHPSCLLSALAVVEAATTHMSRTSWMRSRAIDAPATCVLINVGERSVITTSELVDRLENALDVRAAAPAQPGDTHATYADITRARELPGWEPRVGLGEGLARFGAWLRPLLRGGEALRRDNAQRSRTAGAAGATRSVMSGCALKPVRDEYDFHVVWRKFDQLHREVGR